MVLYDEFTKYVRKNVEMWDRYYLCWWENITYIIFEKLNVKNQKNFSIAKNSSIEATNSSIIIGTEIDRIKKIEGINDISKGWHDEKFIKLPIISAR